MKQVLVVEHDSLQRELVRVWLEAAGARAVWPESLGTRHDPAIDAVLVDVMCQQQAHELLAPWRRAYPHAALVVVSGRFCAADTANHAMARRLGATRILAKPYGCRELWSALELQPPAPPPR